MWRELNNKNTILNSYLKKTPILNHVQEGKNFYLDVNFICAPYLLIELNVAMKSFKLCISWKSAYLRAQGRNIYNSI